MNQAADFTDLTFLVASLETDIAKQLGSQGANVWGIPQLSFRPNSDNYAFDEALNNLFGYDWLIFPSTASAEFFLNYFTESGHRVDELDSLRVCCGKQETALLLAEAQVHVDTVSETPSSHDIIHSIANYLGGTEQLKLLNCLISCASNSASDLPILLDDFEARADPIATFLTSESKKRPRLEALLKGGGVDCAVLNDTQDLINLVCLFDSYDLAPLFREVIIASPEAMLPELNSHGLQGGIIGDDLFDSINAYFKKLKQPK